MSIYHFFFIISLLIPSYYSNSLSCSINEYNRKDCGYMGINAQQCKQKGCCWAESSIRGTPWCFFGLSSSDSSTKQKENKNNNECPINDIDKTDCGYYGINENKCIQQGCCWVPSRVNGVPWCFYKKSKTNNLCPNFNITHISKLKDTGFTTKDIETMTKYFEANMNIDGKGGVAAANDHHTPGGDYWAHWERDGALVMKSFMLLKDLELDEIKEKMESYLGFVKRNEVATGFSSGVPVRIQPKLLLPDGPHYTGGWCRPQTDAPGLRAITFTIYSEILLKHGNEEHVKDEIWPIVKSDLDWLVNNYKINTCDLWEEIRSEDFFFNDIVWRRGLIDGSRLAKKMNDKERADLYDKLAKILEKRINNHYNGYYFKESYNRGIDGGVITGIAEANTEEDNFLNPLDERIANTLTSYSNQFCLIYNINKVDSSKEIPGVLYGRYASDVYAGGNPWQLITANVAKLYYQAALEVKKRLSTNNKISEKEYKAWSKNLGLPTDNIEINNLSKKLILAGDAVMQRLYYHVKDNKFHINEQIDRNTGKQTAAKDLTWSYASVLMALKIREKLNN